MSMIEQVVHQLEKLPPQAQALVLAYVEGLAAQTWPDHANKELYPLRGEPYVYLDPFAPAVPAETWDAVRGVLVDDSD